MHPCPLGYATKVQQRMRKICDLVEKYVRVYTRIAVLPQSNSSLPSTQS